MKSYYNQFQDLATKYLNEYKVEYANKLNNAIETKKAIVHRNYLDYLIKVILVLKIFISHILLALKNIFMVLILTIKYYKIII